MTPGGAVDPGQRLAAGQSLRQVARVLGIGASTLHRAIQIGQPNSGAALMDCSRSCWPPTTGADEYTVRSRKAEKGIASESPP